jgi:hypothetical protein
MHCTPLLHVLSLSIPVWTKSAGSLSHHYALYTPAPCLVTVNTCLNKIRLFTQPPLCIVHPCSMSCHCQYLSEQNPPVHTATTMHCTPLLHDLSLSIPVWTKSAGSHSQHYALYTPAPCPVTVSTCLNKIRRFTQPPLCIVHPCSMSCHYQYFLNKSRRLLYPFVTSFSVNELHNRKSCSCFYSNSKTTKMYTVTSVCRIALCLTFRWTESQTQHLNSLSLCSCMECTNSTVKTEHLTWAY